MHVVVGYESMYGHTHLVAEAIGRGISPVADVTVLPVADIDRTMVEQADLVIVGGPTHLHGMSRPGTRKMAATAAREPDATVHLDDAAQGLGVRDWLASLDRHGTAGGAGAAFDTRMEGRPMVTGRASKGIARELRRHGFDLAAEPESFLVTKAGELVAGEEERAGQWARGLVEGVLAGQSPPGGPEE